MGDLFRRLVSAPLAAWHALFMRSVPVAVAWLALVTAGVLGVLYTLSR